MAQIKVLEIQPDATGRRIYSYVSQQVPRERDFLSIHEILYEVSHVTWVLEKSTAQIDDSEWEYDIVSAEVFVENKGSRQI